MRSYQKRIRTAVAALLAGMLLLCALFIVAEGHHHCCGDECAVCACIRLCEGILHPLAGPGTASASAAAVAPILALAVALLLSLPVAKGSPISEKVRIND